MNYRNLTLIPFALIACLVAGGCATTQIERKQQVAASARDVSSDIRATEAQIDTTLASLNGLLSADAKHLQPAFNRYSDDVDRMRAQAQKINDDAVDLRRQSETYVSTWQKQHEEIQNAELRATSEQRRLAVMDRFQGVQSAYDHARTSLDQ